MSIESVLQRVAALDQAISNPSLLLGSAALSGGTSAPATAQSVGAATEPATAAGGQSFAEALQNAGAGYEGSTAPAAATLAEGAPSTGALPASPYESSMAPYESSTLNVAAPGGPYALGGTTGVGTLSPALGTAGPTEGAGARIVAVAESQAGQAEQPPGSNESPAIAQYRSATAGAAPGAPWCAYFASWAAREAGEPLGAQGEGLGSVSQIWSWAQRTGRAIPNGPGVTPQPGDLIVFGDEHVGIVKDVLPNGDIQTVEGNYENKVALNVRTPTEATGYVNMS
jgi:CHAP domain